MPRTCCASATPTPAIAFWGEDRIKRHLSKRQLYDLVSRIAQALADAGVKKGDRVAGYLPNVPEATAALLATASLGAVWSSCSPDFGVQGVLDRFGQIEPKILFCADGYLYNGKEFDSQEKASQVLEQLPSVEECVVVDYLGAPARAGTSLYDFLEPVRPAGHQASSRSSSTTRSTSCTRRAPPACRSASCTAPAARCCSI